MPIEGIPLFHKLLCLDTTIRSANSAWTPIPENPTKFTATLQKQAVKFSANHCMKTSELPIHPAEDSPAATARRPSDIAQPSFPRGKCGSPVIPVAISDPAFFEIIGAHFYPHLIPCRDANEMLSHFSGNMCCNNVSIF